MKYLLLFLISFNLYAYSFDEINKMQVSCYGEAEGTCREMFWTVLFRVVPNDCRYEHILLGEEPNQVPKEGHPWDIYQRTPNQVPKEGHPWDIYQRTPEELRAECDFPSLVALNSQLSSFKAEETIKEQARIDYNNKLIEVNARNAALTNNDMQSIGAALGGIYKKSNPKAWIRDLKKACKTKECFEISLDPKLTAYEGGIVANEAKKELSKTHSKQVKDARDELVDYDCTSGTKLLRVLCTIEKGRER